MLYVRGFKVVQRMWKNMVETTTEVTATRTELLSDTVALAMQQEGAQEGAQAGVEALMKSGIGTMIQFVLLAAAVFLTVGALFAVAAAGMCRLSQDTSRQADFTGYIKSAGIMLACVLVLGAGPDVLAALGFETLQYISPIDVFTGG